MSSSLEAIAADRVIEELKGLSTHHIFTAQSQAIFARAVELLEAVYCLPVVRHVVRPQDYEVHFRGVEIQSATPIKEGDLITVYVDLSGKAWGRPDAEFDERFRAKTEPDFAAA